MLDEYTPRGLHDFMQKEVDRLSRDTPILDVGSGSGAWLARLRSLGFTDLTGLDQEPPGIQVPFLKADLNRGEFPTDRRFALVTSFEVFEHVSNPGAYLSVIARALRDDGRAIITSPNIQALRYRIKYFLRGKMPSFDEKGEPTHVMPLFVDHFKRLCDLEGLSIVRVWTYPEQGTVMFGSRMRALSCIARLAVPDSLPGDSVCIAVARSRTTPPPAH